MNTLIRFFWICSAVVLLLPACRPGAHELVFHPAHDTRYKLVYKIGGEVGVQMLGTAMTQPMSTEINCLLHFDTLPDGKTEASFAYENYMLKQGKERILMASDSLGNGDSAALQVMEAMRNISFRTVMNPKGQTESRVNTDSVWKLVEAALAPLDEKVRMQMAAAFRPIINDDMMNPMLEQCFFILPGKRVDIGDKWTNQIRMNSILTLMLVNEFELKSVKNGVAEIAVESKVTNVGNEMALPGLAMAASPAMGQPEGKKGFDLLGVKFEADFKGTQRGTFYVDMGTGLMQTGKMVQDLEGKFKIKDVEIPMTLHLKNEYKTEKL
ncbi:MAG: DUF6263 family protein [Chitinophagaceae bacterium]|nr:DUF6263 family protein [Chitinophagaceae bacterium]